MGEFGTKHPRVETPLLITQCLQNDFVAPLGPDQPLPNLLHIGSAEAERLKGQLQNFMKWAHGAPHLAIIHVRDWHDPEDPAQQEHLRRFGLHCLEGSAGADFPFEVDARAELVDTRSFNDFQESRLPELLKEKGAQPRGVGLCGVWTEAKVFFLAYELVTRYPHFEVAVCSALTASSSRHQHFSALSRMERLLGVRVIDSVGEFVEFLDGKERSWRPAPAFHASHPELQGASPLDEQDARLVRYLFRDCRELSWKSLDGGFSGNLVLGVESFDLEGHRQVPHVVKIGPRAAMARERTAFERVQPVLGNNAPLITDFVDYEGRGALKYRYASMGGKTTTFQKLVESGASVEQVCSVLDTVFGEQLMRFYGAARLENCCLLEHYGFSSRWAESVARKVRELLPFPGLDDSVVSFYAHTLKELPRSSDSCYQAYVHGDLNGANIILDRNSNVWLIDFFHTRRAHALMDLIKLENDLLYIFTKVEESELEEAFRLSDALAALCDLNGELPDLAFDSSRLERAWAVVRHLRGFYRFVIREDGDPKQARLGQLRYAVHTLGFEESSLNQRRWALYTAGALVRELGFSAAKSLP